MALDNSAIQKSIIESCKRGNRISQYALYNQYSKAMYNLAYRMMNNREDAEDMIQDSFTVAFRKLKSFRYESTFGAWLKTIVINRCINELRKRKMVLFSDELKDLPEEANESSALDLGGDVEKVSNAIEQLPDGYRVVLTLYLLEGYDHKEISKILGITESTSKSQYLRAKRRLRKQLSEEKISWIN